MQKNVPVKSVKKALDLLTILAFEDVGRRGMSLTALAQRMDMPTNTAHNLLKTMSVCDYVEQTESGSYCIGPKAKAMGQLNHMIAAATSSGLRSCIEGLCHKLNEAITLTTLANGRRIVLFSTDPSQAIRVDSAMMEAKNLFKMPTGRILAAYASPSELEAIVEQNGLPEDNWNGITTRQNLEKALTAIRAKDSGIIQHEAAGLVAFAVPVLNPDGTLRAALGCYAPEFRCGEEKYKTILELLHQTAQDIVQFL